MNIFHIKRLLYFSSMRNYSVSFELPRRTGEDFDKLYKVQHVSCLFIFVLPFDSILFVYLLPFFRNFFLLVRLVFAHGVGKLL